MLTHLRRAFVMSLIFLAVCGLGYGWAGTGVSLLLLHHQAEGSIVKMGRTAVGSAEIGQTWTGPKWFQGRPDGSLLTNKPGGVVVSATQQWGPRSKRLEQFAAARAARLREEGIKPTNDLVTNSGSLVDPDISPADAYDQVAAVARANHLSVPSVRAIVAAHVHGRELGFLGAPYVNVLELNMALYNLEERRHR
jgi:K+-transporting ATPase ATPase C chain